MAWAEKGRPPKNPGGEISLQPFHGVSMISIYSVLAV